MSILDSTKQLQNQLRIENLRRFKEYLPLKSIVKHHFESQYHYFNYIGISIFIFIYTRFFVAYQSILVLRIIGALQPLQEKMK